MLSLIPVILVLLVAEWMVLTGTGSFAGILGFLGVMVHSLMSGIFPALLLVASRRKGELVPGLSYRALGHPLVVGGIYLLFLSNLFLHGLVIWEHPLMRVGGVAIGLLVFVVTVAIVRRGAFAPRVVVELRQDRRRDGRSFLAVTAGGQPASAAIVAGRRERRTTDDECPGRAAGARDAALDRCRDTGRAGQGAEGVGAYDLARWSVRWPAVSVTVHDGAEHRDVDLGRFDGQLVLRLKHESIRLDFADAAPSPVSDPAPSPV